MKILVAFCVVVSLGKEIQTCQYGDCMKLEKYTYCNSEPSIDFECSSNVPGARPRSWIHSFKSKFIRKLRGVVYNNTRHVLSIPFCSSMDIGQYICIWDIPGNPSIKKTTTLIVNGPAIVSSHLVYTQTTWTEMNLKVMFYSHPIPSQLKWYVNDKEIKPGPKYSQPIYFTKVSLRLHDNIHVNISGYTAHLTIYKDTYDPTGVYQCVIENTFGSTKEIINVKEEMMLQKTTTESVTIVGAVLGATLASTLFIVVLCCVVFVKKMRQKVTAKKKETIELEVDGIYQESSSDGYMYIDACLTDISSTKSQ
ncbi:Hypothetical predicted protein [Mytilus galloprovincialis]|uniref:Ig-like domain-containing protein n=1 Tax=Mytilus galloprovincialis TaxID=29158 RepID=A0A8B6HLX2_MYTGA|nr:Hypothetical predicted protein [Mytilus galloprovincialis]